MAEIVKTIHDLPPHVLDEVRRLHLEEGAGPLKISKTVEGNFDYKVPLTEIDGYLTDLKANATEISAVTHSEGPDFSDTADTAFKSEGFRNIAIIDKSSLKKTNETLRDFIVGKISALEQQSRAMHPKFDKDIEAMIAKYTLELNKLTHNEVKLQGDFKDTEKVTLTEVKFYINKIMASIRTSINRSCPDKVDAIFKDLRLQLEYNLKDIVDPAIYNNQAVIDEEGAIKQKVLEEKTDDK